MDFNSFNQRYIYQYMTDARGLYLSIEALDLKRPNGDPNPCVKLKGTQYNSAGEPGSKVSKEVDIYIPIGRFLVFAHDLLGGVFARRKLHNQKAGRTEPYFSIFGGSSHDGKVEARKLALVDGKGPASFAIIMSAGEGTMTRTKAIIPKEGVKPHTSLFFNMPDDEIKELCLIGQAYVDKYIALDMESRLLAVRAMRDNYVAQKKRDEAMDGRR